MGLLDLLGLKATAGPRAHEGYSLCSGAIPVVIGVQGRAISSPDSDFRYPFLNLSSLVEKIWGFGGSVGKGIPSSLLARYAQNIPNFPNNS